MGRFAPALFAGLITAAFAGGLIAAAQVVAGAPAYTAKGELQPPTTYRRWVYLSSGYDMSYAAAQMPGMSMFDNVFVGPAAYEAFLRDGTWPDKTVMVLEARRGEQSGSINKAGHFQTERMAMEVHVKDVARFKDRGGWAFFAFDGDGPGKLIDASAACYSCHAQHAAVDTTFVQFYPTLKPIAAAKRTFSGAYLAEESPAPK